MWGVVVVDESGSPVSPGRMRASDSGGATAALGTAPYTVATGEEDVSEWEHALDSGALWDVPSGGVGNVSTRGEADSFHTGVQWRHRRGAPRDRMGELVDTGHWR